MSLEWWLGCYRHAGDVFVKVVSQVVMYVGAQRPCMYHVRVTPSGSSVMMVACTVSDVGRWVSHAYKVIIRCGVGNIAVARRKTHDAHDGYEERKMYMVLLYHYSYQPSLLRP